MTQCSYGISSCAVVKGNLQINSQDKIKLYRLKNKSSLELEVESATECLRKAGIKANELGLIIVSSTCSQYVSPENAGLLAGIISAQNAIALNIEVGCAAIPFAMSISHSIGISNNIKNILITVSFTLSQILGAEANKLKYNDVAASILLSKNHSNLKIRSTHLKTFGEYSFSKVIEKAEEINLPNLYLIKNNTNRKSFKSVAIQAVPEIIQTIVSLNNISINDLKGVLLHQGEITHLWIKKLHKLNKMIVPYIYPEQGNFGLANLALLISDSISSSTFTKKDFIVCAATGLGWHIGAILLEW